MLYPNIFKKYPQIVLKHKYFQVIILRNLNEIPSKYSCEFLSTNPFNCRSLLSFILKQLLPLSSSSSSSPAFTSSWCNVVNPSIPEDFSPSMHCNNRNMWNTTLLSFMKYGIQGIAIFTTKSLKNVIS